MKTFVFILGLLVVVPAVAEQRLDDEGKPCEEAVDLAERGQFHRLHFECDKKPAKAYEPEAAELAVPVHIVGAEYHAKATFRGAESVPAAMTEAFSQMMAHCPKGWRKDREWVEPEADGYALFYQFTCSDL